MQRSRSRPSADLMQDCTLAESAASVVSARLGVAASTSAVQISVTTLTMAALLGLRSDPKFVSTRGTFRYELPGQSSHLGACGGSTTRVPGCLSAPISAISAALSLKSNTARLAAR